MKLFTKRRPTARAAGVLTAATALMLGTWAGTAQAHGGAVTLNVEGHPGDAGTELHVEAIWEDGDPIEDATVTATPTSPTGEEGDNLELSHTSDGVYAGTLEGESGDWSVEVTLFHDDADPNPATATETITVGEGGGGAGAADTTAPDSGDATEPAGDATETAGEEAQADEEDDGGGSMLLIIILVVVVIAVVGAVIWAVKGRGQEA